MKVINIIGGLGNQMFQYAMAIALKNAFPNEKIKISTLSFRGYPLHNGFELSKLFNITLPYATIQDLTKVAYPWCHYRLWQVGRKFLPRRSSMVWDEDFPESFSMDYVSNKCYFDGYWQSPKFFECYHKEIKKAFVFPDIKEDDHDNINALKFIRSDRTAFIHVRRGDYLKHPFFGGVCTDNYYKRALQILKENNYNNYIIFSNDIEWCENNLSNMIKGSRVMYSDWNKGNKSFRDMQLMSECSGGIIANSSFSWWGAWLGHDKIILSPSRWVNANSGFEDIYCENWNKVNVD